MAKIHEAVVACMGDIGAIGKESRNQQQNYQYRGVDAVMNALSPILQKNGVFIFPEVLEQVREEHATPKGGRLLYSILKVKFHFMADDGSEVCAVVIGEGMDSGDKASNKAMSVAFKYACFQVFCIPTEEMKDPDADSPESAGALANANQRNAMIKVCTARFDDKAGEMFTQITGYQSTADVPAAEYKAVMDKLRAGWES